MKANDTLTMKAYDIQAMQQKWKQYWVEHDIYHVPNDSDKPKYYVLDMFPYPSGAGLHVGHPLGYIASDIFARYKQLKGFNVLHPMGFDAFGLPAEQYAIETGQHPETTTNNNIATFKKQLDNLGFNYDWKRQVSTCDPKYYKWTQWIFLQLFKSWYNIANNKAEPLETLIEKFEANGSTGVQAGGVDELPTFSAEEWQQKSAQEQADILMSCRLAFQSYATVNWCPALGTVLANDEVKDGFSERGGHPVERKKMRQWALRVTAFAERLLNDLDDLAWSDAMKEMQRNWIGRSEGASIFFQIADSEETFEIFTTRPDTIFGVSFMVLAPEHDLVKKITTTEQKEEIDAYLAYAGAKTDRERQQEKKVTGAFTGAYAIHPFTQEKVPIWISEYVLIGYGTGAIMAVPSDDERDEAFATKFNLPIIDIIDKSKYPGATQKDKLGIMINSDFVDGMEVPDAIKAVNQRLEEMGIGKGKVNFKIRDALYSRQRYWGEPFPIVYDENGTPQAISESELPLTLPPVESFKPSGTGEAPLARVTDWVNTAEGKRETDTMPGFAGSSWYFLRYMDPDNEDNFVDPKVEQYWQNVDLYIGGTEHAVGHLIYSRMWHKFLYDRGWVSTNEPFKRLVNQGMIQGRSSFAYRIKNTNQFVSYNLRKDYEVSRLHVPVSMVKNDVLDTEAFKQFRADYADATFILEDGKYVCGAEIEKMSKSKYNVVNPDDIVAKYGTDCLRLFEMFLGPLEHGKPWNTDGIEGVSRFLKKCWNLFSIDESDKAQVSDAAPSAKELKAIHKTIKKVSEDIERLSFNTCVSAFMECVNELNSLKSKNKTVLRDLTLLMAPFAPFITEEFWQSLGESGSVHLASFPTYNPEYIKESTKTYPVQINGKVRAKIELPVDLKREDAEAIILAHQKVVKWVEGKNIRKFIFVPGKIINIVV